RRAPVRDRNRPGRNATQLPRHVPRYTQHLEDLVGTLAPLCCRGTIPGEGSLSGVVKLVAAHEPATASWRHRQQQKQEDRVAACQASKARRGYGVEYASKRGRRDASFAQETR